MTIREVFEYTLTELNKRKAPSLLLRDFNYFAYKAINNYVNFKYNYYDINQQSDDDLNSLKVVDHPMTLSFQGLHYKGTLPDDYLHTLNCSVIYNILADKSCHIEGTTLTQSVSRLPVGAATHTRENFYFKPSYKKPYFYHNQTVLEIRSGDTSIFQPQMVYIDYLKKPDVIELTQEQIDDIPDNSQELQFSHYVSQEIVNELIKLVLENSSDPRLQSNTPVNQTISVPGSTQKTR